MLYSSFIGNWELNLVNVRKKPRTAPMGKSEFQLIKLSMIRKIIAGRRHAKNYGAIQCLKD
jgi:hypothetical protein